MCWKGIQVQARTTADARSSGRCARSNRQQGRYVMAKQVTERTKDPGVYKIHARGCPGGKCRCESSYQATVWSAREGKLIRKHFDSPKEAVIWRGELRGAVDRGEAKAPTRQTVAQAMEVLLAGMADETI